MGVPCGSDPYPALCEYCRRPEANEPMEIFMGRIMHSKCARLAEQVQREIHLEIQVSLMQTPQEYQAIFLDPPEVL